MCVAERRETIGGALLGAAALAFISAPVTVASAEKEHFSSPIVLVLFAAGGACLIAALVAFGVLGLVSPKLRAAARRSPVVLRSPVLRRSTLNALNQARDEEMDASMRIGQLAQLAVPMENVAAISLHGISDDRKRELVRKLIERGAALRTDETNFRSRSERSKPATPDGPRRVNAWRGEVEDLLDAHFSGEAYRVEKLETLEANATSAQVLYVIDESLKPLHNFKSQLVKP
jgi:hypothetical protein